MKHHEVGLWEQKCTKILFLDPTNGGPDYLFIYLFITPIIGELFNLPTWVANCCSGREIDVGIEHKHKEKAI